MQKYIFNMKDILTYQVKKKQYTFSSQSSCHRQSMGLWCDLIFVENCVCVCTVCVCMVNQDLSVFVLWTFWARQLFVTGAVLYYRIFRCILGIYPLDASSSTTTTHPSPSAHTLTFLVVATKNICRPCQVTLVENHRYN